MFVPVIKIVKQIIRKIYFSEERFTKKYKNGLEEHYINDDHRFYTLNGEIITGRGLNRMIYNDDNYFFILNCIKHYEILSESDEFFYEPGREWDCAKVTLYNYNKKIIFQKEIQIGYWKQYSHINKKVLKEYNDNIKIFCNQYLYSKAGKKKIELSGEEKCSLDGEDVIITLQEGEEIRFNSRLEQINLEDNIAYTGEYL